MSYHSTNRPLNKALQHFSKKLNVARCIKHRIFNRFKIFARTRRRKIQNENILRLLPMTANFKPTENSLAINVLAIYYKRKQFRS